MSLKQFGYLDLGADAETAVKLMSQWIVLKDLKAPAVVNAGAATFTAAQVINTVILRSGNAGTAADLVPTATQIVAGLPNCAIGDTFFFWIRNANGGILTVTTNTGVTLSGTMTIAVNSSKMLMGQVTAVTSPAVTIYSLNAASAF